jgi:hypothetical protein
MIGDNVHRKVWLENRKDGDHVRPTVRYECNIKMDLKEINVRVHLLKYIVLVTGSCELSNEHLSPIKM